MIPKKYLYLFFLLVVWFISGAPQFVVAQVTVTIPDTTIEADSSFTLPVYVSDVSNQGVFSVGFTLAFDENVLTAENVFSNGALAEAWGNPITRMSPGRIIIGMAGTTALSGNGKLLFINFKVNGEPGDSSVIYFTKLLINEGEPVAIPVSGLFTVKPVENKSIVLSIPDTVAECDSEVLLPVYASDLTGKDIYSVGLTLAFDENVLTAENVLSNGALAESWGNPIARTSPGQILIGMAGTTALKGKGILLFINFKVNGEPGDSTIIRFTELLLNEGEPEAIAKSGLFTVKPIENKSIVLSMPDTMAQHDSEILLPVYANNLTGKDVYSIGLTLNCNPKILTPLSVSSVGALTEIWGAPIFNIDTTGQILIASAGTAPLTGRGVLYLIKFHIIGNKADSTALHFKSAMLNEGEPPVQTMDGSCKVINSPPSRFNLLCPVDGALLRSLRPVLKWQTSVDVDLDDIRYVLFIKNTEANHESLVYITTDTCITVDFISALKKSTTYSWKVIAMDGEDTTACNQEFVFTTYDSQTRIDDQLSENLIVEYALFPNYPNPFNPETTIQYQIPVRSDVVLRIFNTSGQVVKAFFRSEQAPGVYSYIWNGADETGNSVSSGIYFYQLKTDGFQKTEKMLLVR